MSGEKSKGDHERQEFQKLGQMAQSAAHQAWRRGEPFDFGQFAYGKPEYNWKYPFGPIWKPVVHGVPTRWRAFWGMNLYDYSCIGLSFGAGYGWALMTIREMRLRYTRPHSVGLLVGIGAGLIALNTGLSRSAHRLMGFRYNGNQLMPTHTGYKDDNVPLFVKHTYRGPGAKDIATGSAEAFDTPPEKHYG